MSSSAMSTTLHEIDFFYDPISPYAHLAFERLPQALEGLSVLVRYRPVLFAALLKAHGQLGPAEIPSKRDWTYRQVLWLAQQHGVRLELPAMHPFNPLPLLRLGLSTATVDAPGQTNRYVTELLFHHVWHGRADPLDPARLQLLQSQMQDHMRQRGKPWSEPDSGEVKQRLRENSERALALGLFGVPSIVADGRVFWGLDALPMLRECLQGGAWFQGPDWEAAHRLPVGVQRQP
jgi:2-hydroxychromene-2-carboxylate isomerase